MLAHSSLSLPAAVAVVNGLRGCPAVTVAGARLLSSWGVAPWARNRLGDLRASFTSQQQQSAAAPSADSGAAQPMFRAVTIDLFGTLLSEAIGEAKVYAMMMKRHGYDADEGEIDARYRVAYKRHKTNDTLRYVGDGKEFWRVVVKEAVNCDDDKVFEDIYGFYELPAAWKVSPGAFPAIQRLHKHGVKTAVISDFDTRLRELVQSFGLDRAFDEIVCSAEVGAEKPDPKIFTTACERLGVEPHEVLHIGDSVKRDYKGAKDYGFRALLWGRDVQSFRELSDIVLDPSNGCQAGDACCLLSQDSTYCQEGEYRAQNSATAG